MDPVLDKIHQLGIVPVVKISSPQHAVPLGEALIAGDLPVAEITFRTDAAEESIRRLSSELPDLLVGAGTVLTPDQAARAVKAGAKFIVSPGFNEPVVDYCLAHNIPVTPGVNSPTQIEQGLYKGLKVLKFFPAEASGGLPALKSMSAPYNDVRFVPTGGIKTSNLNDYLSSPKVFAVGGSWMVKSELISGERFEEISHIAREAVQTMLAFSFMGIDLPTPDQAASDEAAGLFAQILPGKTKKSDSAISIGEAVELRKESDEAGCSDGTPCVSVGTASLSRAAAFLQRKGIRIDESSIERAGNEMQSLLLERKIGGFGIRLLQK